MLEYLDLEKILFLDIETVPQYPSYDQLPENDRKLWDTKAQYLVKEDEDPQDIYRKAGIYAEFGRIICISAGFVQTDNGERKFRVKSFFGGEESEVLSGFIELLNKHYNTEAHLLCAHNGKEFDFPYMARRMLINGLKLPLLLDIAGKKPWEVRHLDTMELWSFGDRKSYTSINLLTNIFNIPTPKDDIDGSMVWQVYWEEKNISRIVEYCQKDVLAVAQLLLRYRREPLIDNAAVIVA